MFKKIVNYHIYSILILSEIAFGLKSPKFVIFFIRERIFLDGKNRIIVIL